jgi:hypothetical protein
MSEIRMVEARRVRALDDYRLEIVFDEDATGVIELTQFVGLGEMTEPLRDSACFRCVFVEMGTPTWPNGMDWSPEALHADMAAAGALKFESAAA